MFEDTACKEYSACCVMSLYSISVGVTSGACSNRGQHVLIVVTNVAMCVGVKLYILIDVIVNENDVLS